MKKLTFILTIILCSIYISAREAVYNGDDYFISAVYNDKVCPGDAVFVKMTFSQSAKKGKSSRADFSSSKALLELIIEEKMSRSADFFTISKNTKSSRTLLAGIPVSTWWTPDTKCALKIKYSADGIKNMEFELPLQLESKEFVYEVLDLDQSNTDIKTDTSVKRMEQIRKLNGILGTTDQSAIYQLTPFSPPTEATRRTSFFADRREYRYTNGKSSSSLHYGIDYGIPEKSDVLSCAAGKVVLAETRITTGWSVVIEHLPGLYSLYYHMSELNVREGDIVKAGQLIGLSGSTGLATGPHLHWEVRLNGEAVNPDYFLTDFSFSE